MVKICKNTRVLILSFVLGLLSIKAEADNSADFFYEEPIVYQKTYQVPLSKEKTAVKDDGDQPQVPIAVYIGDPNRAKESPTKVNIITKAHRTKVSTPLRGPSVVANQEAGIVLDMPNNQDKEANESASTSENEENVFEVVSYTRDILGRGVPIPDVFVEEIG